MKQKYRKFPTHPSAFSFVEMVVSVALVSLLSVAAMITFSNTQQRTGQPVALLTRLRQQNEILRLLADDLHWCQQVNSIESDKIEFMSSPLSGKITWRWDESGSVLYRGVDNNESVLSSGVHEFMLEAKQIDRDGSKLITDIAVSINLSPDESGRITRTIPLLNKPGI